jgi:hypothetical protein
VSACRGLLLASSFGTLCGVDGTVART